MSTIAKVTITSGNKLVLKTPGPQGPPGDSSGGDVAGPASATAGNVPVFSGTTGKILADGGQTPAQLKDRANHTGTQAIATVTGLQAALDAKEVAGASSASMSAHLLAADPHTQYATNSSVGSALASKAPLTSPALAGTPTAPTAAADDNTTKLATTAFVQQEIANDLTKAPANHTHSDATTGASGFMSATDKVKLNQFTPGASAVLSLAAGKTGTFSNTITIAGTDGSTLNIGAGGTLGTAAFTDATAYAAASHTHNASDINAGTLPTARMPAHTGEVTSAAGAVALSITNDAVTNAKLANMAASTIKGNNTVSSADPADLTAAQVLALISPNTTRGDITIRGASVDAPLAIGAVASTFVSNGTDPKWRHSSKIIQYHDHFIGAGSTSWGLGWLTASNVGGGNTIAVAGTTDAPGILEINTGTGASNDRSLTHSTAGAFVLGNGILDVEWRVRIPTLSTSSERFLVRIGLGKGQGAVPSDGFWLECIDNVNSGNWQVRSAKASAATAVNSSVAPTTNWTKVRLIGNAAGTQIDIYVDGVLAGSITDTTKIPTTASFSLWTMIQKSVGTTARSLQHDYVELYHEFATPL